MKKTIVFLLLTFIFIGGCKMETTDKKIDVEIYKALERAEAQCLSIADSLADKPNELPKTIDENGHLVTSGPGWWCSGFFPGELWYLYENSKDPKLKELAHSFTMRVEDQKNNTSTHDVGFMIFCSFGNAFRLDTNATYADVIFTAAASLSSRFNPKIGAIRSWDGAGWNNQWQYPVIIDNMMNLELLTWTSRVFGEPMFADIANKHAYTTIANHFRDDNSSYHVVSYDTLTGRVEVKQTSQGYSDESAWARGQAWGLYGFTMMYRETGDTVYLNQAQAIADFILNHPNFPDDKIPYWDFNAPGIPNAKRDASAGAIMCSALLELSKLSAKPEATEYLKTAETQLMTLCSEEYLAKVGENGNFILKHGVGHMPNSSEVDVPLSYADYYFIEALMRYKKWYL